MWRDESVKAQLFWDMMLKPVMKAGLLASVPLWIPPGCHLSPGSLLTRAQAPISFRACLTPRLPADLLPPSPGLRFSFQHPGNKTWNVRLKMFI